MACQKNKLGGTKRANKPAGSPQFSPATPSLDSAPEFLPGESPWAAAWNALAEPVWLLDQESRIRHCNHAAHKYFGSRIIGRHCWEVAHGAKERIPECPFSKMCQTGGRESTEVLLGTRWFHCTVDPLRGNDGKISGAVHILRDISAEVGRRSQVADGLDREHQLLRTLIDLLPDFIFVKDIQSRFLIANKALAKAYGHRPSELLSRTDADFMPPPIAARCLAAEQQVLAGKSVSAWEDTVCFPDGRTRTMVTNMAAFRDAQGAVRGLVGIGRDLTRRKRMEETLRDSEGKFHRLFATVPDAVFLIDAETRKFVEANDAALRLYGYTRAELRSVTAMDLTAEPEASNKSIRQVVAGEATHVPIRYHQKKDGTVFPVEISASVFVWQGRNLFCSIVRDITNHLRAEAALRASESALQQAQRLAGIGNWEWDILGGRHVWSEGIYHIYGRDPALPAAVYPEVRRYFTRESWARLAAAIEQARAEGAAYECDAEVVRPDGSHRWIIARGQAVRDAAGKVVRLHGTVQDITERKKTEQLMRRANRTLQAIRDCHEAMLRAGTERELLLEICRIIVLSRGERMTWVGLAEPDARKTVRPVASAGVSSDYLKEIRVTWADAPRGRGPVGTAIRTGLPCLCRDTQTDPNFALWRASARRHGYGSILALPLLADQRCFGALSIYAPDPDAFDAGEQLMLMDLANDLAFGVNALRLRAERERLEDEILKSTEREQERIGRDLHDGLCQLLVGAKFRSVYLRQISGAKTPAVEREARALETMLNHAIEQARNLARGLNPVHVTPAGLVAALQKLADDVESTHQVHCFARFPKPVKIPDHHAAYHLYRIAQEAVQNALKHARAKNISFTLTRLDHRVRLVIKDDGVGLPRAPKKTGMGMNNMQTRARITGGRLEIRRRQNGGTAVICELPIQGKNDHETSR